MAGVIRDLLTQLFRIALYDDIQAFEISALNISIGPPKHLLKRHRTADRTIRRAYSKIVKDHGIPVVTSAGNDGPVLGLLNPWALADGVIAAGATDAEGKRLWTRSSRAATKRDVEGIRFFVAHGENTIGPLASGLRKTEEMLQAEKQVDMAAAVGTENVGSYAVRSGTSFAAGVVSHLLCYPHQMMMLLRGYASAMERIDNYQMKAFVRGYIDTGIDESHPVFKNRLVDKRYHFGGLRIPIDRARKEQLFKCLSGNAIDVSIRYSPDFVFEFLKAIARPVPGSTTNETGYGFVSEMTAAIYLREARYSTLIQLLAPSDDPRRKSWLEIAEEDGDPQLFSEREVAAITDYCRNYDLVLALPLRQ